MQRRLLLVLCAGAAAAAAAAAPPEQQCDLLVVGAGVSGSFCAARYRQFHPEATVCVVESSTETGGRLQSLPLDGVPYAAEFGGMRFFPNVHKLVPRLLGQLGLETTVVPYVNDQGLAYVRGSRIKISELGSQLSRVYNLRPEEKGVAPNVLYDRTIKGVLARLNVSVEDALSAEYLTNHTMFNVLMKANLSREAVESYTDTAGYEWVLGSNAAVVAQEDLAIEGWNKEQIFVKTGFQSLVTALENRFGNDDRVVKLLEHEVTSISWSADGVEAAVNRVEPSVNGNPIPRRMENASALHIKAGRAIITANALQLFSMGYWPWRVKKLLFDVEQVATVKMFVRFSHEWWDSVMPGSGRSITTLPLRQVWVYAPKTLMIYGDGDNARFWRPYFRDFNRPTPTWRPATEMKDLASVLFGQLAEMFETPVEVIEAADPEIAFAYWARCTSFWAAGCDINAHIALAPQPMEGIPLHLASDLWSSQQGWVEGALLSSESVMAKLGIPSIAEKPMV